MSTGAMMNAAKWLRRGMIALSLLAAGCSYHDVTAKFMVPYEQGDFARAASEVTHVANKADKKDRVVLRLEQGAILRAAGEFPESAQALDQADALITEFDQRPDVSISREAIAALSNL